MGVGVELDEDPMGMIVALVVRLRSLVAVGIFVTDGLAIGMLTGTAIAEGFCFVVFGTAVVDAVLAFVWVLLVFLIVGCFRRHLVSGFALDVGTDGPPFTVGPDASEGAFDATRSSSSASPRGRALEDRERVRREADRGPLNGDPTR